MMVLYVYWILLLHFVLSDFPLTTTHVSDLCQKGHREEQVYYRLGICYYHPNDQYQWHDAIELCETRNTHLIHLETGEEQDFIMQKISISFPNEVWLGLKKTPETNWAWFYNTKLYPVLNPRWSTTLPSSRRPRNVAQTYHMRTWGKINKDTMLKVVCEDPLPPELTNLFCVNHPTTAISKWGPLPDFHCYYFIGQNFYTQGKTQCETASTHIVFLETLVEESWMENELEAHQIHPKFWLGIEKNETDQWNWRYRKLRKHVLNPRFMSDSSTRIRGIFDNMRVQPGSDLKWKHWAEDRRESVICEEDIYPKLMSELLCYRRAGAVTGIFNPTNNHCYYVHNEPTPFPVAKEVCESRGSYVATLEYTEEQLFVENEAYNYISSYSFWLGLRREVDGNWYWLERGGSQKLVEDDRWFDMDSGLDGHAVTVEDGRWIPARKMDLFPFICEEEYDNEMVIHFRVCTKFLREAIPVFYYETRSCYYLFDNITTWKTARETCSQSQTYVVHPDTEKEQSWLSSIVTNFRVHDSVWIGIESKAPGQWSWRFSNHAEVTQNTRFSDSSKNTGNNVMMFSNGTWEKVSRDHLTGLICEDSISPLSIQEAMRVNVGSIVYVTQREDETTTSLDSTIRDSTTIESTTEDTPEDLTTNENVIEDLTTTEIATDLDTSTGGPDKDRTTAGAEIHKPTTDGKEDPKKLITEPITNPESTPEDVTFPKPISTEIKSISPSKFDPQSSVSKSATDFTDVSSSAVIAPGSDESSEEPPRSYSPETISSSMTGVLDTIQTIQPISTSSPTGVPVKITPSPTSTPYSSSEHLTTAYQTTAGVEFCPNADSLPGGYVIETPYRKNIAGHYKHISRISTISRASNLRCAKQCSLNPNCWFYTRDESKTCILYRFHNGSTDSFDCSEDVPCYFKACQILNGGS